MKLRLLIKLGKSCIPWALRLLELQEDVDRKKLLQRAAGYVGSLPFHNNT